MKKGTTYQNGIFPSVLYAKLAKIYSKVMWNTKEQRLKLVSTQPKVNWSKITSSLCIYC